LGSASRQALAQGKCVSMPSSLPSNALEKIVGWFLPPACREEVLGDLCERYKSPLPYVGEAIRVVPCVIVSRIRRTSDPQELVISAILVYASIIATAWWMDRDFLNSQWGLLKLFIPSVQTLIVEMFAAAWQKAGKSGKHSLWNAINSALTVFLLFRVIPPRLLVYGSITALVLLLIRQALFPATMEAVPRPVAGPVSSPALSRPWRDAITLVMTVLLTAVLLTAIGRKPRDVAIAVSIEAIVVGRSLRKQER
jgi:hypothetical protein